MVTLIKMRRVREMQSFANCARIIILKTWVIVQVISSKDFERIHLFMHNLTPNNYAIITLLCFERSDPGFFCGVLFHGAV